MSILIHSMGKTGSMTIRKALEAFNINVFFAHHIQDVQGEFFITSARNKANTLFLDNEKEHRIITPIREPIARNVSAFFHNLTNYYRLAHPDIKVMTNLFLSRYAFHSTPADWFYKETLPLTGINVFKEGSFNSVKGYGIYKKNNISLLVIRAESLNTTSGKAAFKEFLNLDIPEFGSNNQTVNKNNFYLHFLKDFEPPVDYVKALYSSDYTKTFYGPYKRKTWNKYWKMIEE